MATQFKQGRFLEDEDLNVFFYYQNLPYSPVYIRYEYGYNHPTDGYHKIGSSNRIPIQMDIGRFRPNFIVSDRAQTGSYTITWKFKVSELSPEETRTDTFEIITEGIYQSTFHVESYFDLPGSLSVFVEDYFDLAGGLTIIIEGLYDLPADLVAVP